MLFGVWGGRTGTPGVGEGGVSVIVSLGERTGVGGTLSSSDPCDCHSSSWGGGGWCPVCAPPPPFPKSACTPIWSQPRGGGGSSSSELLELEEKRGGGEGEPGGTPRKTPPPPRPAPHLALHQVPLVQCFLGRILPRRRRRGGGGMSGASHPQ